MSSTDGEVKKGVRKSYTSGKETRAGTTLDHLDSIRIWTEAGAVVRGEV